MFLAPEPSYPVIGQILGVLKYEAESKKKGDNYHAIFRYMRDTVGMEVGTVLLMFAHTPWLFISDPDVISDMYLKNNKFFNKHPMIQIITHPLLGNSSLFSRTDEVWRQRRKAMSAAFYKQKLGNLFEIAKSCMQGTLERWL